MMDALRSRLSGLPRWLGDAFVRRYGQLAGSPALEDWNLFLVKLGQAGLGVGIDHRMERSGERRFLTQVLPGWLATERPICADVGANVGDYARALRECLGPAARILAFEPHPLTYRQLAAGLATLDIECIHAAVDRQPGRVVLHDRPADSGTEQASLLPELASQYYRVEAIRHEVPAIALDDFARERGIEAFDFVKIDVEGLELRVLEGARGLLERGAIRALQFEFNVTQIYAGTFFRDIHRILPGYQLFRLTPGSMLPLPATYSPARLEHFGYQNIVARRVGP
jgi:FkbM family methyltransferase